MPPPPSGLLTTPWVRTLDKVRAGAACLPPGLIPAGGTAAARPEGRLAARACLRRVLGPHSPLHSLSLHTWPLPLARGHVRDGHGACSLAPCACPALCWDALPWPPGGSSRGVPATVAVPPGAEVRAAGPSQAEAPHCPAGRARHKARGLHKGMPTRKLVRGEPSRTSATAGCGPEVGGGGKPPPLLTLKRAPRIGIVFVV